MAENIVLTHERVDDIPLLIGLGQKMGLPEIVDRHLGNHGHHQGLSNGWLTTCWIGYIMSESNHCKSSVEGWAQRHHATLEQVTGQPIRPGEFNDDRLGIVLRRLSDSQTWENLEEDLWQHTVAVYQIEVTGVRLDSTTASGYHTPTADGVMQHGHSKDHRPDLPQLKLMVAAAEPSGHLVASDVYAGQRADDPLYQPLLARVRRILGRRGLLYVGDSKMAALATRADIVAHGDFYLMPLPLTGETADQQPTWIDAVVAGTQAVELLWDGARLVGGGYEFTRPLHAEVAGQTVNWTERVQVVRSRALAHQQTARLAQHLGQAEAALRALTPPPGRGKRQYRTEDTLQAAIARVVAQYDVAGLLPVTWQREEQCRTVYVGRGRGGPNRPTRQVTQVRYVITAVQRDTAAIQERQYRLGWRVQVTSMPREQLSLTQTVLHYNGGWCQERDFHLLKDRPLGISPLYVRRDDQIIGLTHLLTLALRLQTLLETQVRRGLTQAGETLTGLYEGQPKKATDHPTAVSLLKAIARAEITLTHITGAGQAQWHLTPLPDLLNRVLTYMGLNPLLYKRLTDNSS